MNYLIGLLIAIFGFLIYQVAQDNNRFNAWTYDCIKAKGSVSVVKSSFLNSHYECFVDGEIVTLQGWEQY